MKTQALSLEGGAFRKEIDLSGLPGGVYLLTIQAPKRQAGDEQRQERALPHPRI
ncbi:MAG: hypothetical protein HY842_11025 [Bacteroidetes bacterium]|nr:hypothetical protein [Bacteroidota bacterium]